MATYHTVVVMYIKWFTLLFMGVEVMEGGPKKVWDIFFWGGGHQSFKIVIGGSQKLSCLSIK